MLRRQFIKLLTLLPTTIFFAEKKKIPEKKPELKMKDRISVKVCNDYIKKTFVTKKGTIIKKEVISYIRPNTRKIITRIQYELEFDTPLKVIGYTGVSYHQFSLILLQNSKGEWLENHYDYKVL